MKTMKLFLTFALIGFFQLAYGQYNVHVIGQLTNTNGAAIQLSIALNDGGTWLNANPTTDAVGYYQATFSVNASQGTVNLWGMDCNSDTIQDNSTYNLNTQDTMVTFAPVDYCPTTSTGCQAYFSIAQATTAGGAFVPGSLIVTDSSSTTGAGNLTYNWSFGDSTTGTGLTLSHTYSGNGPYILCLSIVSSTGCVDTYCDTVSVDSLGMLESEGFTLYIGGEPALGIDDQINVADVNIYPNPAVNYINIELKDSDDKLNSVIMYDLSGKKVFEENTQGASNNLTTINTENIEPGTYLIQMQFDNKIYNRKVIIK